MSTNVILNELYTSKGDGPSVVIWSLREFLLAPARRKEFEQKLQRKNRAAADKKIPVCSEQSESNFDLKPTKARPKKSSSTEPVNNNASDQCIDVDLEESVKNAEAKDISQELSLVSSCAVNSRPKRKATDKIDADHKVSSKPESKTTLRKSERRVRVKIVE